MAPQSQTAAHQAPANRAIVTTTKLEPRSSMDGASFSGDFNRSRLGPLIVVCPICDQCQCFHPWRSRAHWGGRAEGLHSSEEVTSWDGGSPNQAHNSEQDDASVGWGVNGPPISGQSEP